MNIFQINYFKLLYLLLLSVLLGACDPATDCITLDGPEFSRDPLPAGLVNQEYYTEISFFINNNPNDSSYSYYIDFSGKLPKGIYYSIDYDRRKFILAGIPQVEGAYNFTLNIEVADNNIHFPDPDEDILEDGNDFCYEENHKDFTVVIN